MKISGIPKIIAKLHLKASALGSWNRETHCEKSKLSISDVTPQIQGWIWRRALRCQAALFQSSPTLWDALLTGQKEDDIDDAGTCKFYVTRNGGGLEKMRLQIFRSSWDLKKFHLRRALARDTISLYSTSVPGLLAPVGAGRVPVNEKRNLRGHDAAF